MDQLQLPFAQRLVEEVHLAGHVGTGIVVGDDKFTKGRALFLRERIAALEGQDVPILIELADKGPVIVGEDDIAFAAGQYFPEPDMESAEAPQLSGDPIKTLCFDIGRIGIDTNA